MAKHGVHVSIYRGAFEPHPVAADTQPWPELVEELHLMLDESRPRKTMLPAFAPHRLRKGAARALGAVAEVTALVLDYDACDPNKVVRGLKRLGLASFVYGSPSDDPHGPADKRRVRVVCPVSRPITVEECRHTRLALSEALGYGPGHGVEGCIDAAKLFFLGRIDGAPEREHWTVEGSPVDVDALVSAPLARQWGRDQKPAAALSPLSELPPADAGIVAALGDWQAHEGRRWYLCGAIGGLMRKLGFPRSQCEAVIREWLPANTKGVDVEAGVKRALGAYAKNGADVSGFGALAEYIGTEHAEIVSSACERARRDLAAKAREERARRAAAAQGGDEGHTPATPAAGEGDGNAYQLDLEFDVTRQGNARPTHNNVLIALAMWFGNRVRLEECSGRIKCAEIDESLGYFPDGLWRDAHTTSLVALCERNGLYVPHGTVSKALVLHAQQRSYNALTDHALKCALAWDRVARIDKALSTYWGATDSTSNQLMSKTFFTSLAARALQPGEKIDTTLILVGGQGAQKSSAFAALVGKEWFADSPLPIGDKEAAQNIRGKWLWEFPEHATISRRELNLVKQFLAQEVDTYRASYGQFTEDVARQTVFCSSANDPEVLNDPTGNRRFMPVTVGRLIDRAGIERDREQLIGEAATRVLEGERYWLTLDDDLGLESTRAEFAETDPWESQIAAFVESRAPGDGFTVLDICTQVLLMPLERIDRKTQTRVGAVLARMKLGKRRTRSTQLRTREYFRAK